MEIELGPFLKYEQARSNAYWAKAAIDTKLRADDHDFDDYKAHITGKPNNYPSYAIRNKYYMDNQREVKILKEGLKAKLGFLYPRTNHIRKYIVSNHRVLLDSIEPIKKYTTLDKISIFVKRFI